MSRPAPRLCRVIGCTNKLRAGYLMCPDCWCALPRISRLAFRDAVRSGDKERLVRTAHDCIEIAGRRLSPLLPESAHA